MIASSAQTLVAVQLVTCTTSSTKRLHNPHAQCKGILTCHILLLADTEEIAKYFGHAQVLCSKSWRVLHTWVFP